MATMKDVAKAAGVSIATVSRVLAGNVPVTDSTQKKVLAAVEELQYHGGPMPHGVGKRGASLIAVCVQDLAYPYDTDVLRGVEDVLSISGYYPLLFNVDNDQDTCRDLLQSLLSLRVGGAVFIGCGAMLAGAEAQLSGLPLILLDDGQLPGSGPAAVVSMDAALSGDLAAKTLLETGGRRFLYLTGQSGAAAETDPVYAAFAAGVEAQGGSAAFLSLEHRQAWEQVTGLLRADECPDGLLLRDGMTAAEIMRLLRRQGKRVPEDVSVLCLENTALARFTDPALSVVGPAGYQMGMVGTRHLIQYLDEERPLPPTVQVAPKLVKRGSLK